ncbi:MAG: dicarboxylate/amino acid:cation symporter [Verrucomicrobia bacterium]|nr:dicarboxylate/amino acid:cation symporter [Verrucomicrobiota bacterium]
METASVSVRTPWYRILYVQVLLAVAAGILVGYFFPGLGKSLKPLGDAFIRMVKMMIAPIIFCTVVHGIASMGDLRRLGRTGWKTLLYFEVVSTLALVIGLVVVNVFRPGEGFNLDVRTLDPGVGKAYLTKAHGTDKADFFLNIIPSSFLGAFTSGDLLQVLFIAILTALAITLLPQRGRAVLQVVEEAGKLFFGVMGIVVKAAPIGAFGAMGYTVGGYGLASLNKLLALMMGFYLTSGIFVVLVLGLILKFSGVPLFRYLAYIKDELLLVLGTSSSETALPGIMKKLEQLGCAKSTVGLVIPTGYSFNLDGTNIYMTMAAVFLAQATNTPLDFSHQVGLLLVAMVTSKGASGVTGAGFVTLAATLEAVPGIPIESLAILVGIDRFMSECRAIVNFIGNGVAAIAISRWEGEVAPAFRGHGHRPRVGGGGFRGNRSRSEGEGGNHREDRQGPAAGLHLQTGPFFLRSGPVCLSRAETECRQVPRLHHPSRRENGRDGGGSLLWGRCLSRGGVRPGQDRAGRRQPAAKKRMVLHGRVGGGPCRPFFWGIPPGANFSSVSPLWRKARRSGSSSPTREPTSSPGRTGSGPTASENFPPSWMGKKTFVVSWRHR